MKVAAKVRATGADTSRAESSAADPVAVVESPGSALDGSIRSVMGSRFGYDFSRVRIHADARADRSARALGAAAYTLGDHVVFRQRAYDTRSLAGVDLIAHELAHVVQHSRGGGDPGRWSEGAADRAADLALRGLGAPAEVAGGTRPGLARQSEEERRRRQQVVESMLPKSVPYLLDPGRLDREYRAALAEARRTGDWRAAAEILNGFNHVDIQARLAELTDDEVGRLHRGALDNRKVGPGAQVAKLTRPGVPRASTIPPRAAAKKPAGAAPPDRAKTGLTDDVVRRMSKTDRLLKAYDLAPIGEATAREIASLVSPRSLVLALLTFATVYLVSQATPVGWAATIGLGITAIFVGSVLWTAISNLVRFAKAATATTVAELEEAGRAFAKAVAAVGVQAVVALLLRRTAGPPKGAGTYKGPPPTGFADAVAINGVVIRVPVKAGSVSTTKVVTPELAAQLGLKAVPSTTAMMTGGGPTGSGSGSGSLGRPQTGKEAVTSGTDPLRPGKSALGEYGIDRYGTFANRPKDKLAGHEMLQNLWLEVKGFGKRLGTAASRDNPAVGLSHAEHVRVGREQRALLLLDRAEVAKLTAVENIELNALAMNRAGIPNEVIMVLKAEALRHARSLGVLGGQP